MAKRACLPPQLFKEAAKGDIRSVQAWLEGGGHVDAIDTDGRTLLMAAAATGSASMTGWLLSRDAEPNVRDAHGGTALIRATLVQSVPVVRLLLQAGADRNARMNNGSKTAIEVAQELGSSELLALLCAPAAADPSSLAVKKAASANVSDAAAEQLAESCGQLQMPSQPLVQPQGIPESRPLTASNSQPPPAPREEQHIVRAPTDAPAAPVPSPSRAARPSPERESVVASCNISSDDSEGEMQQAQLRGNAAFGENNFREAAVSYTEALQAAIAVPRLARYQSAVLLSNRAACYLQMQQTALALRDARLAVSLAPDYAKAHYRLAKALQRTGDERGAAAALRTSRELQGEAVVPKDAARSATASAARREAREAEVEEELLIAQLRAVAERANFASPELPPSTLRSSEDIAPPSHSMAYAGAATSATARVSGTMQPTCDTGEEDPPSMADAEARLSTLLEQLRCALAGSEERRLGVLELLQLLRRADGAPASVRKPLVHAFVDNEGPRLLHDIESSMSGNWIADAKNGTLQRISEIAKLPGPVGTACSQYRGMSEQRVEAAALHKGCDH